jgi:hypothetical protein
MLVGIKALMKISRDRHDFWQKMDIAYPQLDGDNYRLQICHGWRNQNEEAANWSGLFFCADQKGQIDLAMLSTVLMTSLMTRTTP